MTISQSHFQGVLDRANYTNCRKNSTAEIQCFQNYYHGHQIVSPNPHYIGNVRSSVNHWQLRDLIKIDLESGSVFHAFRDLIRVLSIRNRDALGVKSRTYLKLPYFARCFNHAPGGLFVTGGLDSALAKLHQMKLPNLNDGLGGSSRRKTDGLFSVYSPAMASEMTFILGDMINNAVTIYPNANSTASYTSYVCNNDSYLYLVDISDSGVHVKRRFICEPNVSLNNVLQSPDRSFLAATGDSGSIFLIDTLSPKAAIKTIRTNNDSGFGISFHNNEYTLASAFQNGSCLLYDLRNTSRAFHEIKSSRPNHQSGAFRSCKFLNSSTQDLLAILEHVGRVHLIDLRNLGNNHQVVVFPLALDQFSRYKEQKARTTHKLQNIWDKNSVVETHEDDDDTSTLDLDEERDEMEHARFEIFGNAYSQFPVPLVYDYQYLTNENPQLFRDFKYEPPIESSFSSEINSQRLDGKPSSNIQECSNENILSAPLSAGTESGSDINDVFDDHSRFSNSSAESHNFRRIFQDSYMQTENHVNGEMQLSGLDWYNNQLYICSEDGGISEWDINVRGRRSFGSFSFA